MNLLFIFNSAALGFGLAMDAFSVSLANGLHEPHMSVRRMSAIAGVYAVFQFAMPMIGWILVKTLLELLSSLKTLIPWIALILLLYIGGKMILEALISRSDSQEDSKSRQLTPAALLLQGIATSIDALSVGFTLASYTVAEASASAVIIGAVTLFTCFCGLHIGKKVGMLFSKHASILGGCILIAIGIEIFIQGIL